MRFSLALLMTLAASLSLAAEKPNIVVIVSDDQGYNDLGVLGDHIITPNLDRLAREGVRLTNFYVTWPACTPSRGAWLTGRYPQRNGIYDMIRNEAPDYGHKYGPDEYAVTWERIGGMDTREILLPQMLKKAGYYSGIFGKWDLGMHRRFLPLQRGWDEFYGFVNTGIDYYTHERYGVPSMYRNNSPTTEDKGTYCTDLFRREAVRFIKQNKDRPFFLYLPFNAPHGASNLDPLIRTGGAQAPEKWRKMYPKWYSQEGTQEGTRYGEPATIANKALRMTNYLGAVTAMDDAIGEVLNLLDEYGLSKNTIVVFFADNGGSGSADNAPLRGHKGLVFEGGIRVCCPGPISGPNPRKLGQQRIRHFAGTLPNVTQPGRRPPHRKVSFSTASTCCPCSPKARHHPETTCSGSGEAKRRPVWANGNGFATSREPSCSICPRTSVKRTT